MCPPSEARAGFDSETTWDSIFIVEPGIRARALLRYTNTRPWNWFLRKGADGDLDEPPPTVELVFDVEMVNSET